MKTAMQELIDELKQVSKTRSNPFITTTINLVVDMAEEKIEKEKQSIIDSYNDGREHGFNKYENAEDYYYQEFEKK